MRIELCGGIGAGKTTLAKRLATKFNLELACEDYNSVPFWREFCRDYKTFEFEKNVGFLLTYGNLMRNSRNHSVVFDFSIAQALAFIEISDDNVGKRPLRTLARYISAREGIPSLVIRVRCEPKEQIQRIKIRSRKLEIGIESGYLVRLEAALDRTVGLFCSKHRIKLLEFSSSSGVRGLSFEELCSEIIRLPAL
jgi:deoxyguanosine kinase